MPQASLLSYFSKPVTPNATVQTRHIEAATRDAAGTERLSNTHGLPNDAATRGVVNEIWRQTSQLAISSSCSSGNNLSQDQSVNQSIDGESSNLSISQPSSGDNATDHTKIITVSHLPEALITPVQQAHLSPIQRLTSTTLPVRYSDAFFTSTLSDPIAAELSRVVLYSSVPVGWIRCRLEPCSPGASSFAADPGLSQIYIQALALLSPYRTLGLATLLLKAILDCSYAKATDTVCIYAHVWEKNEDALEWYTKRGFKRIILVEGYYRRLRPSGAWVMRRELDDG